MERAMKVIEAWCGRTFDGDVPCEVEFAELLIQREPSVDEWTPTPEVRALLAPYRVAVAPVRF